MASGSRNYCSITISSSCFTGKDLQSFLEGFYFRLPAGNTILIALTRIHAGRFQLFKVSHCGIELFLDASEVSALSSSCLAVLCLMSVFFTALSLDESAENV